MPELDPNPGLPGSMVLALATPLKPLVAKAKLSLCCSRSIRTYSNVAEWGLPAYISLIQGAVSNFSFQTPETKILVFTFRTELIPKH